MGRRSCSQSCQRLLQQAAETVASQGRAEIVMADGRRSSAWRTAPESGGLLVLAPRRGAESLGLIEDAPDGPGWQAVDTELPATALIHSCDPASPVVQLHGWLCAAPPPVAHRLALRFSARHPTSDLLGVGEDWFLLRLEVIEAQVCGGGRVLSVPDTDTALWLAAAS